MADMGVYQADLEQARKAFSLVVRCGAVTGTIILTDDGAFSFSPEPRRLHGPFGWFSSLLRPVRYQSIPAEQLLGARLESPSAFTVWHATECSARMGCVSKRLFRVRHTRRFEARDPRVAEELVGRIRSAASWWGRDKPPHVAAVVNPKAGRGGAVKLFRSQLLPLLRDVAGLRVTELVTAAPGHATEMVREMPLRATGHGGGAAAGDGANRAASVPAAGGTGLPAGEGVDLIMFVGGDGTLHEGLQGLLQRPDWDSAREVPLVAVPCGSGNGVAASTGLWDLTTAAVAVCRGRTAPVDVASALQPPNNRFYCLLSVVYGAMANLDIGTNHLRWMGELRFHLGGLREIIRGRCYNCRVFVLPPDAKCTMGAAGRVSPQLPSAAPDAAVVWSAGAVVEAPARRGGGDDGRRAGDMQEPLLQAGGPACGADATRSVGGVGVGSGNSTDGTVLSQYPSGPPLPLLSQLPCLPAHLPDSSSALPHGWEQLADSFAIFGAYNTQYLALGARANPGGLMGDGSWEVWQLEAQSKHAGAGLRLRCLKVLLGVEDGSFAKTPGVMHVTKARAVLFQQRDSATWTVLDGEAVPDAPLYMEVHPRLCNLLVSPLFREEPL